MSKDQKETNVSTIGSKMGKEELLKQLDEWWKDEDNMKQGLLIALAMRGKKEKGEEVAKAFFLRKQAYTQIKKLIEDSEKKTVPRGWMEKQADRMVNLSDSIADQSGEIQKFIKALRFLEDMFKELGYEVEEK